MLQLLFIACTAPTTGGDSSDLPDHGDETGDPSGDSGDSGGEDTGGPITVSGFASPESVLHDTVGDVYLVSNINGGANEVDDNGFISKLAPDGTVLDLTFISGADLDVDLNAPKGSYIVGDWLWVADIDVMRVFDRETGEPLYTFPVDGASFLNDVTSSGEDGVFVSDSAATGSQTSLWGVNSAGDTFFQANGDDLPRPNGLHFEYPAVFALSEGELVDVQLNGNIAGRDELPAGQLDGLVIDADGSYLASSWETNSVYRKGEAGWEVIADGLSSPADIGYDAGRNRLLVPLFLENEVVILPL